jgi:hypothetical protein
MKNEIIIIIIIKWNYSEWSLFFTVSKYLVVTENPLFRAMLHQLVFMEFATQQLCYEQRF